MDNDGVLTAKKILKKNIGMVVLSSYRLLAFLQLPLTGYRFVPNQRLQQRLLTECLRR